MASVQQKEALLQFMECHTDFARGRVKSSAGRATMHRLRNDLAQKLNVIPGAIKTGDEWKRVWDSMRSSAREFALSNGRPKPTRTGGGGCSSEEEENDECKSRFTTDNPFHDRVLNIISWESALGVGIHDELSDSDEDKTDMTEMVVSPSPVIKSRVEDEVQAEIINVMRSIKQEVDHNTSLLIQCTSILRRKSTIK